MHGGGHRWQRNSWVNLNSFHILSRSQVYDAVMHTKLCVALAAANICPASDW